MPLSFKYSCFCIHWLTNIGIILFIIRNSLNDAGQLGRACNILPHIAGIFPREPFQYSKRVVHCIAVFLWDLGCEISRNSQFFLVRSFLFQICPQHTITSQQSLQGNEINIHKLKFIFKSLAGSLKVAIKVECCWMLPLERKRWTNHFIQQIMVSRSIRLFWCSAIYHSV